MKLAAIVLGVMLCAGLVRPVAAGDIALTVVNIETPQGVKIWEPTTVVAKKGDTITLKLINRHADEHGYEVAAFNVKEVVDGNKTKDVSFKPSDLTRRPFKGGSAPRDIIRTVITGFDATPMPSYHLLLDDGELWDLARYVASLARTPEITRDEREGWHVVRMHQRRSPR